VKKIHKDVISPPSLNLQSGTQYSLHSVINHHGENAQSGHYNLALIEPEMQKCILLDDESISFFDNFHPTLKSISYISIYVTE
jgi:uncharacterized UBP type Zn finger protein